MIAVTPDWFVPQFGASLQGCGDEAQEQQEAIQAGV
jgi:hypothetical protein